MIAVSDEFIGAMIAAEDAFYFALAAGKK